MCVQTKTETQEREREILEKKERYRERKTHCENMGIWRDISYVDILIINISHYL